MVLPHDRRSPADPTRPQPPGCCDRCGFRWYHHDLRWQFDWIGNELSNLRLLVCPRCEDVPQPNGRRPVVLPPDPVPVKDPRPGFMTQQEGPAPPVQSVQSFTFPDD